MNLIVVKRNRDDLPYEFVERKGKGHPDTLSDGLAEYLSAKYSQYTLKKFGAILHHNFDKVGLLGGSSSVQFGSGKLVKPIRVLLNGRVSTSFGKEDIPVKNLLAEWSKEFLKQELPLINSNKDLEFLYNISTESSPGKVRENDNNKSARQFWFQPRGLQDLPELKNLVSNDTSLGVGYAPYSPLERLVLDIENHLNSDLYKTKNPWIGSDIKIMGFRYHKQFDVTLCVPQIANFVASLEEYKLNLLEVRKEIMLISKKLGIETLNLFINTRDSEERGEFYLTAIGSSIESGDEGLVGRGNRVNGVISPFRPMSMEGVAGKNPVYHIGKIYYVVAQKISESIHKEFGIQNEVILVSQSGRDLLDPWIVFINVPENFNQNDKLESMVNEKIKNIPLLTNDIINLKISIC